ncbi:UNVERIFIED_CONTAM: hypothetical protein FKN15_006399 [Acipenser sinensis]
MTTRSEREKALKLNEQHQAILSKMLREEDNKYCADCEAKGFCQYPLFQLCTKRNSDAFRRCLAACHFVLMRCTRRSQNKQGGNEKLRQF